MNKETEIETARLILRPWREADAESLYKYASEPEVGHSAGWPVHASVEESVGYIRTVFSAPETYAVVLKHTGEPVGSCGLMFSDGCDAREAEVGYWIGKPYWGLGLIPEAVDALLARGFDVLGLDAVWCGFYVENHKSRRVSEKCGFRYHHTVENVETMLGDRRNEHRSLITREDYLARQMASASGALLAEDAVEFPAH